MIELTGEDLRDGLATTELLNEHGPMLLADGSIIHLRAVLAPPADGG